jgi:outer membrane biosynthesis protein TonB
VVRNKEKYEGIIGTDVFHAAMLLFLFLLGFSTPLPLQGEEGVKVNLGVSEEGFGDIQSEFPPKAEEENLINKSRKETQEAVVTQDTEESTIVEKKKTEKNESERKNKSKTKEIVKEEPKVNPAALYRGKSTKSNGETGEGIMLTPGDQGKPTGTTDSKNYSGTDGSGDGMSFSLAGRYLKFLPKSSSQFNESGTVVVQIDVDKYGKVLKALAIDKDSNTTNTIFRRLAEEAAKKAVFNASTDAAGVQRGTITYYFVVKN